MENKMKKALYHIAVAELVGILSSLLSGNSALVYNSLAKPPLSPPGWIFGPVWVILFALMGYAAFLIADYKNKESRNALNWYRLQLCLNFIWPVVFFRFQMYTAAVVVIVALIATVAMTILEFRKIDEKAGWLLLPYMAWLLYAAYLNIGFAFLN